MDDQNQARARACEALYDAFVRSLGVDLVHILSPFDGFGDDTVMGWTELCRQGPIRAATVHDLIPFAMPKLYLTSPIKDSWYHRRLQRLAGADLLLTISGHTRRVVLDRLKVAPERVINISAD